MDIALRAMSIGDYQAVFDLWRRTQGIGLNESDTEGAIEAFLRRNPDLSAVTPSSSGEPLGAQ